MSRKTNITKLHQVTKRAFPEQDPSPDKLLEEAKGAYDKAFLIGYDQEGELDVRSSGNLDQKEILFMLDMFKHKLMNGDYWA